VVGQKNFFARSAHKIVPPTLKNRGAAPDYRDWMET